MYQGEFRVIITPENGNIVYLEKYFRKNYPQAHIHSDGFFLYLQVNIDCSSAFLIKIKELPGVKTVYLNMDYKPHERSLKMTEPEEKIGWEKTFSLVRATIEIKPECGYKKEKIVNSLTEKFPTAKISRDNGHVILETSTQLVTDLLTKIQAVPGVSEAKWAI